MKSQWMTWITIFASILFLMLAGRMDLLIVVLPISLLISWLIAREAVSGQRRI